MTLGFNLLTLDGKIPDMATATLPALDSTTRNPPRYLHRIPMSLRIFLALIVVVGISNLYSICDEPRVLEIIRDWGGTAKTGSTAPAFLRRFVRGDQIVNSLFIERVASVDLSWTEISDDGVRELRGLTNLRELELDGTLITDAGLSHLSGLRKLEYLKLDETSVTDAGLVHLRGLQELKRLSLNNRYITQGAIEGLQKALPACKIESRQGLWFHMF